jgi:CDP-6-deoxy-D-xylo-4-hexulose-3-dehydrase
VAPPDDNAERDQLRAELLSLSRRYFAAASKAKPFTAGESPIPVTQKVLDADDLEHLLDASLDLWLTSGRFTNAFEAALARTVGVRHALFVNSGSSANLLAIAALTSPQLDDRLRPGDEVITTAVGFPTTVNAIVQNGCVPVFIDVELGTYNATAAKVEAAIGPRTRAIFLAHTLGNPFAAGEMQRIANDRGLRLIEDCCDALGGDVAGRSVGTFGDFATLSFYPAHHITTGEGGAVLTRDPALKKIAESFRDWGRDCWCDTGCDNTCGKRFEWQLGDLPLGYDHKYIYSHIGYNLKATDMQAALGLSQLAKLPSFRDRRRANFARLHEALSAARLDVVLPHAEGDANPSWFGFPITLGGAYDRKRVIAELERRKIATRLLFGGNVLRQPAYRDITHRVAGSLENAGRITTSTFWIGVHPGLDEARIEYLADTLVDVLSTHGS